MIQEARSWVTSALWSNGIRGNFKSIFIYLYISIYKIGSCFTILICIRISYDPCRVVLIQSFSSVQSPLAPPPPPIPLLGVGRSFKAEAGAEDGAMLIRRNQDWPPSPCLSTKDHRIHSPKKKNSSWNGFWARKRNQIQRTDGKK